MAACVPVDSGAKACVCALNGGFLKEEVDHAYVVVEECPVQEIIARGITASHVSASAYNAEQCAKDELLLGCFAIPYDDVRYTLLSHNHILIVLRAFLTQAHWDIPANAEEKLNYCDSDGRLSVTAVAASDTGKEVAEVLQERVHCEVLSYKMDI